MNNNKAISLSKILEKNLVIPDYQRPYEWNKSNVYVLLDDIYSSYKSKKENGINLGSIILNKKHDNYEIVDGQQRLITLSLLLKAIDNTYSIKLLDEELLCVSNTEYRIINNYMSIREFIDRLINNEKIEINSFYSFLKNDVKFYILEAKNSNEAFQLFDGRNSKYRDLTPVDLLKAYHLGLLPKSYPSKKRREILKKWNENITYPFKGVGDSHSKIEYLYNNVLFNIYNWSLNKYISPFTKNDIYLYKGFKVSDKYSYVKYYKNNGLFQINKPFKSGEDFFWMTYENIKKFEKIIKENKLEDKIKTPIGDYNYSFKYINYLYYDALFAFSDRFGEEVEEFYNDAVKKFILQYSILLRVKRQKIDLPSLNYYVLNTKYNFFFECSKALRVEELLKLEIEDIGNRPRKDEILGKMRYKLWNELK